MSFYQISTSRGQISPPKTTNQQQLGTETVLSDNSICILIVDCSGCKVVELERTFTGSLAALLVHEDTLHDGKQKHTHQMDAIQWCALLCSNNSHIR